MDALPHRYTTIAKGASESSTVTVSAQGVPDISTDAPAEFGGPGNVWSPEALLMGCSGRLLYSHLSRHLCRLQDGLARHRMSGGQAHWTASSARRSSQQLNSRYRLPRLRMSTKECSNDCFTKQRKLV